MLISRAYLSTWPGALHTAGAVLLVRNTFFLAARFRYEAVPEVLPDGAVLFQIDQHTNLAAPLIGDELDSAHASIIVLDCGRRASSEVHSTYPLQLMGDTQSIVHEHADQGLITDTFCLGLGLGTRNVGNR